MQLCDTHCHLDNACYEQDFAAMLERAQQNLINRFIIPAAFPDDLEKASALACEHEQIYFATGVHPCYAHLFDKQSILKYIHDPKCIAIGECGLDYFKPKEAIEEINQYAKQSKKAVSICDIEQYKALQKEVFIEQIALAIEYQKPLIVHIREASLDAFEILMSYAKELKGGVLHCFNAAEQLLELAPYGFYYGIGGVLTFKNARKLVEILPKIPLNRLLLETDSPYLTPHPYRGKRNEPSYIPLVLEKMSEILAMPKEELASLLYSNTRDLFYGGE